MNTQLLPGQGLDLIPAGADKHHGYRLGKSQRWQEAQGPRWHDLDLAAYRDDLLSQGYAPLTVAADRRREEDAR
jgi:hypothetical protein